MQEIYGKLQFWGCVQSYTSPFTTKTQRIKALERLDQASFKEESSDQGLISVLIAVADGRKYSRPYCGDSIPLDNLLATEPHSFAVNLPQSL